jgi:hypothetical protein
MIGDEKRPILRQFIEARQPRCDAAGAVKKEERCPTPCPAQMNSRPVEVEMLRLVGHLKIHHHRYG